MISKAENNHSDSKFNKLEKLNDSGSLHHSFWEIAK